LTIYRVSIYNLVMNDQVSQSEFYILLSLAIKSRHGYEIMKQVEQDSGKKMLLGPGTLYGSIKRMLQSKLIEEIAGDNPRRKYYTLTEKGRTSLSSELQRYNDAIELAKRKKLFKNLGLVRFAL
jgi:DNA-binding PadR family transcriptional regulator